MLFEFIIDSHIEQRLQPKSTIPQFSSQESGIGMSSAGVVPDVPYYGEHIDDNYQVYKSHLVLRLRSIKDHALLTVSVFKTA